MTFADTSPVRTGIYARFLSRDAVLFAIAFVIVPNLPSMAMWYFITPLRLFAVPFYLIAGLIAVRLPLWAAALMLAGAAIVDVLFVISGMFDLRPYLLFDSLQFAPMLDLGGSRLYMGLGAIIIATVSLMVWMTKRYRPRLANASPILALLGVFAWVGIEISVYLATNQSFGRHMSSTVEFGSAIVKSGLSAVHPAPPPVHPVLPGHALHSSRPAVPARPERNLLIVMVEGMGAYASPHHTALLSSLIETSAVRQRYEISSGTSPYIGSTTGAAARELCGEWADYLDYRDAPAKPCLPRRLSRAGYETIAVHGFKQGLFDRDRWYPKIGFERLMFGEQLLSGPLKGDTRRCGLTFIGLCDRTVGEAVRGLLTQEHNGKRFIYWLTLNTHMLFNPREATQRFDCTKEGGAFGDNTVCYLSQMWADIIEQTVSIATDPALPPTDILIVGDHHTPLFTRTARSLFIPGKVAWFALKAKPENPGTPERKSASNNP